MHQNAEERLERLHTIAEIVHMEVDKRMDTLTAPKATRSSGGSPGKMPRRAKITCVRRSLRYKE